MRLRIKWGKLRRKSTKRERVSDCLAVRLADIAEIGGLGRAGSIDRTGADRTGDSIDNRERLVETLVSWQTHLVLAQTV